MANDLFVFDPQNPSANQGRLIAVEAMGDVLRNRKGPGAIMFLPQNEGMSRILRELSRLVPGILARKLKERQETRIEGLLECMLDFDPLDTAETRIDVTNAEMRRDFLEAFKVLDAIALHERAGHEGSNKSQTAASWRKSDRILGLPFAGKTVYPDFQFDADGQPWPLMRDVLKALPADWSGWQRAFWMVSPNEWLDEGLPFEAIRAGDRDVIEAAAEAGRMAIG